PVSFEIGVSPDDPDTSDRQIDPTATRPDITVLSIDTGDTGHGGELVDGSRGELVFNEDGTFDYNPDPGAPAGLDTFTVEYPVEDPANPGETILVTETLVFQHDGSGNVTPLAPTVTNGPGESFFDDPDNNTPDLAKASLRVDSVDNAGNPGSTGGAGDPVEGENGILVFNNDGTYDYLMDPNAPLGAGETETFTVTYTDENGKETVETLVFVGDGNGGAFVQPPTSDNIVTADDSDNRPVDPDTDKPDILVTSLNTGDTGEGGELVDGQLGNLVFNEDGTFDYNPIPDAPAGVDIFTVRYPVTDPSNPNKTIDVVETLTFINDGNGNVTILDPTSGQIGGQGDPDTTNPPVPAHTPASEVIVSHPAPGGGTETTSGNPLDGNFGVIVVNPDGTFDYVPDQDAPAGSEDTFLVTYPHPTIPGKTVTETLTFVHDGNGDAPIVPPDSTGDLDRPGESPNINSQLPIVVESLETGDSNTPGHLVGGEHSDIVFNPDGTFDINVQPDATPLPGETETFRVTYFDPQFNQQTQDIVVEYDGNGGANVLPFAHDAVNTAVEDTAGVSGDLVAYDVDSTDPVVVSGGGAGQFGTLTIDAQTGAYDYALDNLNGQVQALAEGETLTDTFTYTVTDAEGGSVTRDVTITVVGVNDKPVGNDDTISINEDTVGSDTGSSVAGAGHGLLSNDSDVDTSDEHRVSKITVAGANYTVPDGGDRTVSLGNGTLTVSSDGSYRFDPGQGYQSLNAGESATETFTYTILDNHGGTDTATVTIEIGGVNDGPAITINELTLEEGETVDITPAMIAAADVDDDPVDLVFTVTNLAGGEFLVDGQPSTTFTQQDINDGRVQFVHDGGEIPPAYDLTVTDSGGLADSEPLTANYTPINDAPVANDDSYTTDENTPKTIKPVSANDTDAENDHLVITEIDGQTIAFGVPTSLASGAEVTVKANGDVVYNPNGAFEGLGAGETATDSFTYLIDDGNGGTDTATVTFNITGVNDGPTITANTMTLQEGETIPITTANINATDPDDSSPELTFTVTNLVGGQFLVDGQPATSFTLKDVEDGRVQFEHDGGEKAPSYTLTVADPDGLTDSAPLTANYTPINDAPVANDDSGNTNENTQKTVSLVGNDTDAENNPLSIVNLNGSFAGVGIPVTLASGATVMSLGNGDVIYNPNGAFESLVDGQTATDTFTYTISDGQGGSDTATVTMTITGVNDAPVITANTMTITEGQTIPITTANISATDADHGPTDLVFTVSNPIGGQFLVDGQPATSFTQQDIADGRVQFQHDGGEHAPSYTLTVTDPGNLTDNSPLTVNYTAINDAPVANDDAVSTNENTDKSIAVLGNDTDAEGDPLQIISANGAVLTPGVPFTLASGAQITLLGGEIKYSPNGAFESLGTGDTATDSFTYTIDDGHGGRDTATVTVTINGVNDAPVANDDGTSVDENGTVNLGLIGNDTDAEDGTPTISKIGNTAVTPGSMVTLASGAIVTVNADGSVDYDTNGKFDSLAAGQTATDSFVYTVVDSEGLTDTATATFTITGTNDAPVAADNSATTTQNSPKNVAVLPNDTDAEGQTLSITEIDGQLVAVGVPIALASGALVTLKPDGTIDYNPNGQFNSLAGGQNGTDTFTYTISDGHGGTDTASVVMTITGVNDAPVAMNDLEHVAEDGVANFDPRLNDIDPDLDPLAITQINGVNISVGQTITLASGAEVTLKADGTVDYDPNDQFELPVG
ncbi:MAG: tandem-95 repeat protein, partial [Verrucomicrobiae bacterium]|nr:tandem-95 repeat protein [Verrucomicrobiae bacterium]